MTTRADNYSLHYRITRIERTLGIVNKWTRLPEGADIHSKEDGQKLNAAVTDEQKQPSVPLSSTGNGG